MKGTNDIKTVRMKPDGSGWIVAAGVTNVTSDILDAAGYSAVRFLLGLGAITAGAATSLKVQHGDASDLSDAADVEGSSQTIGDTTDNKVFISEIIRPTKRYLRVVTSRATQNAAIEFLLAELFGGRARPISKDGTVSAQEIALSPITGTA